MIYVALLRGINVGGKNTISMSKLKESFEQVGLGNVRSYINSGNIMFSTSEPRRKLPAQLEQQILADFSLSIKVLLKSLPEIEALVYCMPADFINDETNKADVIFLWPEADEPSAIDQLIWDPDYETLAYLPGVILWHTTKTYAPKSKVLQINRLPLYQSVTIRNPNTVRKLLPLMQKLPSA